jgi:inhibitor of KinA sporulation pathway (predicted exonuclease)
MADLEAIMLFRDDRDYLWCLASECGLDFTGTRYTHITDAIEAARQAFPGCHS